MFSVKGFFLCEPIVASFATRCSDNTIKLAQLKNVTKQKVSILSKMLSNDILAKPAGFYY